MKPASHPEALRLQDVLGTRFKVVEFEHSTHTAAEAAAAVGCELAQIAKSLVFTTRKGGQCVLVIASGAHRVDTKKIAAIACERVRAADADFIREVCGFEPGGVSPVGHRTKPLTILDASLARWPLIWAAAGTPNAVFSLTPDQLREITGAEFADIAGQSP
ncbi:MAG: YbaK/EbsC family protein [Alphaproteobacteria bacterium]|nr:YbaK/EbsC family protein [Alphaproteobacteria bacterium]